MASLTKDLSAAASAAFEAMGLEAKWGEVRRSDKPELADFQCNGAMGAAKSVGRVPRDVAAEVAAALKAHPMVLSAEVAGPGFINIRVSDAALSARAETVRSEAMAGAEGASDPQVTVIDFGGPNVAKPMHVGHLRSAVIGDTLCRLLRFMGDHVTGDTHLGDWGLQMGHLVTELYDEQPGLLYFDAAYTGPYPEEPPVTIDDLARMYPAASAKAKEDPARLERSQKAVAELQAGRPGYRALLKHFIDVSVAALKVDYEFLNVHFDLWKGESDVDHLIPELVERFKKAGLAEEDDGATIVRIARDSDKKEMPPIMLVNSRGGTGYHTTDLATILDRMQDLHPTPQRMLYVVDQRQALHFEQVFRAAEMVGLIDEGHLEHIGFGTVNGPDGKPFKTREGGVLRLADLIQLTKLEVQKKLFRPDAKTGEILLQEGLHQYVFSELEQEGLANDKGSFATLGALTVYAHHLRLERGDITNDMARGVFERKLSNISPHLLDARDRSISELEEAFIDVSALDTIELILLHVLCLDTEDEIKSARNDPAISAHAGKIWDSVYASLLNNYVQPISVAALRFSDLMNTRTTNYVFDIEKFTSFEGKTGPYLLYAAVRVKSLLRRAEADGNAAGAIAVAHDAERALVLQLDNFAGACLQAREKRMPHVLCEHLYNLAQAFSSFYSALPIAAEADPATRASRLGLASAVLKQLETGLDLLGIRVPERM